MLRRFGFAIVLFTIALGAGGQANAQYYGYYPYGYGQYGWGGWGGSGGSSYYGDVARGLGVYAAGEGVYNQRTAVANSINADTVMRLNEYIYESQRVQTQRYYEKMAIQQQKRKEAANQIAKRIRENPDQSDINSGDALNAILDEITNPKIHSSVLRLAKTTIPAAAIKEIPFNYASQAVTVSLAQLASDEYWPPVLKSELYAPEREAYLKAINDARVKNDEGQLTGDDIAKVREALRKLKAKLDANPPQDKQNAAETYAYIRGLAGFARMLEKPSIDRPLAELDKFKDTSIGNLLAFMHAYNLRFGPATTARQRAVYAQLYPILDETRDKIMGKPEVAAAATPPPPAPGTPTPAAPRPRPTDFFQGIPSEHLFGPDGQPKQP